MLIKLLKYDLKWTYKNLVFFYIFSIIFAILTRIFLNIENSIIFNVIGHICSGTVVALIINVLINSMIRVWVRFTKNIYSDESYLTHTLPVKKETIYLSKFILAIITMFTNALVILLSLFIAYYSKETLDIIKNYLDVIAIAYDTEIIKLILTLSSIVFLEMLFIVLIGFTGIILGYKYNNGKKTKSILFSILIYFMIQTVSLLIVFIFGLFNPDIMKLFTTNELINADIVKKVLTGAISLYTIYIIIIEIVNRKLFKQGINVE